MKFEDGKEYFIWDFNQMTKKNCLAHATLFACDHCKEPATVNSVWIMNRAPAGAEEQATALQKEYGKFTELGADDEGDSYCENCYSKHANLED